MKVLFVLLDIFFCNVIFGQCILLDMKLNECSSCYNSLQYLNSSKIRIPVFTIFAERMIEDSSDIDYKLKLSMFNIKAVYSDELHKRFFNETNSSTAIFVDENGEILSNRVLKTIDRKFVEDTLQKYQYKSFDKACKYSYFNNIYYKFNFHTGNLKMYIRNSGIINNEIKSSAISFDLLQEKLTKRDEFYFKQVGNRLNKKSSFSPQYFWMDNDEWGNAYLSFTYLNVADDTPKFVMGEKQCIAKFNKEGQLVDMYPIEEKVEGSNVENDLFSNRFIIKDSLSIISFTHNPDNWFDEILKLKPDSTPLRFISEYKIKDGRYYFDKSYSVDLPYIHRIKYFDNYLTPEFSSYPVFCVQFGNELWNVENGVKINLINETEYKNSIKVGKDDLGKEDMRTYQTFADKNNKTIYAIYKWKENYYLNKYNWDLVIQKTTILNSILHLDVLASVDFDGTSRMVYFNDKGLERSIGLPLDLF